MSKLLLPVIASIPRRSFKFSFTGTFDPSIEATPEFVTHGGLPINKPTSSLFNCSDILPIDLKISPFIILI